MKLVVIRGLLPRITWDAGMLVMYILGKKVYNFLLSSLDGVKYYIHLQISVDKGWAIQYLRV